MLKPLPPFPSSQTRNSFSSFQLVNFNTNVCNALANIIQLPPDRQNTPANRTFVITYASSAAQQALQDIIWEGTDSPKFDDRISHYTLVLAEHLVSSAQGLDLLTIFDLCIAFSSHSIRLKALLASALNSTSALLSMLTDSVVPAFAAQLGAARERGLYALRRTGHCLLSLLRPCPPALVRSFAHSRALVLALAHAYADGLSTLAKSYGGLHNTDQHRALDDWERVWIATKIDLIDACHVLLDRVMKDVVGSLGTNRLVEVGRLCDVVGILVDANTTISGADDPGAIAAGVGGVPFLDRSLIMDYQYAYDLSGMLASTLLTGEHTDARVHSIESTLRALDVKLSCSDGLKQPGVLMFFLKPSVVPTPPSAAIRQGLDSSTSKGKEKPPCGAPDNLDIDIQLSQVLDVFPHLDLGYIRKILMHSSYSLHERAERVIEALLDGTAPVEAALGDSHDIPAELTDHRGTTDTQHTSVDIRTHSETGYQSKDGIIKGVFVHSGSASMERRNAFDDQAMDPSRVHIGKKRQATVVFRHSTLVDLFEQARRNIFHP